MTRPRPTKHTFTKTRRLLDDFFKIDEYRGSYERYDNSMSPEQRLLVFERGDAAAVLLYDPTPREVILVEQFRLPTVHKGSGHGWILEPAAGMVRDSKETPWATAIRELIEETGYDATDLLPIATFFVSPGGMTERIFLFFAEVQYHDKKQPGGGKWEDVENVNVVRMPVAEFFAKLRNQEFEDAKLIIAAHWLKERLAALPVEDEEYVAPVDFNIHGCINKTIGYRAGDILGVKDIDVWVNPINSDVQLDRFDERTISAVIRKHGADKDEASNRIKLDTIGEELRMLMGGRYFMRPGKGIDTSSGALLQSNNVKRIFHVVTWKGEIGEDAKVDLETIEECIDNTLWRIEQSGLYRSVLFPLLGTGGGGLPVNRVAPLLFDRAIKFFRERPKAMLNKIHFLAYSAGDREIVAQVAASFAEALEPRSHECNGRRSVVASVARK